MIALKEIIECLDDAIDLVMEIKAAMANPNLKVVDLPVSLHDVGYIQDAMQKGLDRLKALAEQEEIK